jgi:putative endonuclease
MLTNRSGTLYTGATSNLSRRMSEHKSGEVPGFTAKYRIARLVYVEVIPTAEAAFVREKQIKGWVRKRKVALVESPNPTWKDLSESIR